MWDSIASYFNAFDQFCRANLAFLVEQNTWVFLFLTVILGGGAAFMAGRSLAGGWKPIWLLMAYMIPFTGGLRFLHYALFQAQLTSLLYFITHGVILVGLAVLGYRITRVNQMTEKYPWLYEKVSPFGWRDKA